MSDGQGEFVDDNDDNYGGDSSLEMGSIDSEDHSDENHFEQDGRSPIGNGPPIQRMSDGSIHGKGGGSFRMDDVKRLRVVNGIAGALEIIAAAVIALVVFLVPYAHDVFLAPLGMLLYDVNGPSHNQYGLVDFGHANLFLVVIIALACDGFFVRLMMGAIFYFNHPCRCLFGHSSFVLSVWLTRLAVVPIFFAVALMAAGVSDASTVLVLALMAVMAQVFLVLCESEAVASRRAVGTILYLRAHRFLYAGFGSAVFVTLAYVIYWFLLVTQNASAVPLISWIYCIPFFVFFLASWIWLVVFYQPRYTTISSRINTWIGWSLFDAIGLIILSVLLSVGTANY